MTTLATLATPSRPTPIARVVGLFLLALLATVALIALDLAIQTTTLQVVQQTLVFLVVLAVQLFGLWRGVARARLGGTTWLAIAAPVVAWLAVVWWLAPNGGFRGLIGLPLAITLPLIVGVPLLLRSRRVGLLLDALPATWLVGVQVYRIFGSVFLVAWLLCNVPGIFAVPAGVGDVLVGLLALPAAALLLAGSGGARTAAIAWNVLGILDLADAVLLGFLSSPTPFQLLATNFSGPNLLTDYPLVMIPAFAVPASLLLHALSLRQLGRATGR